MIVFKQWKKYVRTPGDIVTYRYEGWLLFGFIPLYVRRFGGL